MARGRLAVALAATGIATALAPAAAGAYERCNGAVCAEVTPTAVEVRNGEALRRFDRLSFRTVALTDRRSGGKAWGAGRADFSITLAGGVEINSRAFTVRDVDGEAARARRAARGHAPQRPRPASRSSGPWRPTRASPASARRPWCAARRRWWWRRDPRRGARRRQPADDSRAARRRRLARAGLDRARRSRSATRTPAPGASRARPERASRSRARRSGSRSPTAPARPSW